METKTCSRCGEAKPLDDYYAHPTTRDRRKPMCKNCSKQSTRRWQQENRAYYAAYMREYRYQRRKKAEATA